MSTRPRGSPDAVALNAAEACRDLHGKNCDFVHQWVPGHVGIPENEEADRATLHAHNGPPHYTVTLSKRDLFRPYARIVQELSGTVTSLHAPSRSISVANITPSLAPSFRDSFPSYATERGTSWNIIFSQGTTESSISSAVRGYLHYALLAYPGHQQ